MDAKPKGRKTATDTKVLTAHVPLALAEKIDGYAERLERSRGWIVKQALADWVEWEERKHQMTLEAMAEIDAGRFIKDDDMAAWIESFDTDRPLPPPSSR